MNTGFISYLDIINGYGFIACPELNIDHIYFRTSQYKKSLSSLHKGAMVTFDRGPFTVNKRQRGARSIVLQKPASFVSLRKACEMQTTFSGVLIKIGDDYFVKEAETHIYIRLCILLNEINLEKVYGENLKKLIDYRILSINKRDRIRAIKLNREFAPQYDLVKEGLRTNGAVITGITNGYNVKIFDNIFGFLPISYVVERKKVFKIGDIVDVVAIKVNIDKNELIFNLAENIDSALNSLAGENPIVSHIVGDKFSGTMLCSTGFGIFVDFGSGVGLLHISNLFASNINLPALSKVDLTELYENVFHKGVKIEVTIENKKGTKCSLNWDKTLKVNKEVYDQLNLLFRTTFPEHCN